MTNSIKRLKILLVKFFSIALVVGFMASCASVTGSDFEEDEAQEKTTVNSNTPESTTTNIDDEMDPIITEAPRGRR